MALAVGIFHFVGCVRKLACLRGDTLRSLFSCRLGNEMTPRCICSNAWNLWVLGLFDDRRDRFGKPGTTASLLAD
jgi:hypothetical protein